MGPWGPGLLQAAIPKVKVVWLSEEARPDTDTVSGRYTAIPMPGGPGGPRQAGSCEKKSNSPVDV